MVNPSIRSHFHDPLVQKAVILIQNQLAIMIPADGFQRANFGKGPSGISVQLVCLVSGRDPGLWTFEVWGKPDGTWLITYKHKHADRCSTIAV